MSYKNRNKPSNPFTKNTGYFTNLRNPQKYVAADKTIIYRSGMEYKFCVLCDTDKRILEWASEPFHIPYWHPIKKRRAKYYPDYYIKVLQKDGSIKTIIVEVKPAELTPQKLKKPSKYASRKTINNYNKKLQQIAVNTAKYKAAKEYCAKRGAEYMFVTESFFNSFR